MLSAATQAAMTRRSEALAEAMRRALIQALLNALNDWAVEPIEANRKAATRIMRRFESEARDGIFPTPAGGPFGVRGNASRFGLPCDLRTLLDGARDILPQLVEVERRAVEREKAEAREARKAKRLAKKPARKTRGREEVEAAEPWEGEAPSSGALPWE